MKKNICTLVIMLSVFWTPLFSSAAQLFPKSISIGNASSYDAGTKVSLTLVDGDESVGQMTDIEYGVAQAFTEDYSTSYSVISTESKNIKNVTSIRDITLLIPNMYTNTATSSYVVYLKYSEKNNPDKKKFFFTDKFAIRTNDVVFTRVKNIELLHGNGDVFKPMHGPTIYSPEYVKKDSENDIPNTLATSTSLRVTFESNQDTLIAPVLSFSKLRSDVVVKDVRPESIAVKKGQTVAIIPLPTFEYAPGVYQGKITFVENFIKNDLHFQYIIGGDSVTIGQVDVIKSNNTFTFEIFNTPIDIDRYYESAPATNTPAVYTVYGTYINKNGNSVGNFTKEVDFNESTFTINAPQHTFLSVEIAGIQLKVVSKEGKVVFEGSKNIAYTSSSKINLIKLGLFILYAIFLLLVIIKRSVKLSLIFIIITIILSLGVYYKIYSYSNEPVPTSAVRAEGGHGSKEVVLTTEDDLTTKKFTCGQPVKINYEFKLRSCANLPSTGSYDIGFEGGKSIGGSQSKNTGENVNNIGLGVSTLEYPASQVSPVLLANTSLVVHSHVPRRSSRDRWIPMDVFASQLGYRIPILNTCADTPQNPPTCSCSGRTQVCSQGGFATTTTPNSPSCSLQASCTFSTSGTTATFNTIVTYAIGALTYIDVDTGNVISNPYQKQVAVGGSVVQRTRVTDVDGTTALAVCTAVNTDTNSGTGGVTVPTTTATSTKKPTIKTFIPNTPIVQKGKSCVYNWSVEDIDRCALIINKNNILLDGSGLTGPVSLTTADGNNQRATLTCVSDELVPKPEATVATTTLCQVLPEVIER